MVLRRYSQEISMFHLVGEQNKIFKRFSLKKWLILGSPEISWLFMFWHVAKNSEIKMFVYSIRILRWKWWKRNFGSHAYHSFFFFCRAQESPVGQLIILKNEKALSKAPIFFSTQREPYFVLCFMNACSESGVYVKIYSLNITSIRFQPLSLLSFFLALLLIYLLLHSSCELEHWLSRVLRDFFLK